MTAVLILNESPKVHVIRGEQAAGAPEICGMNDIDATHAWPTIVDMRAVEEALAQIHPVDQMYWLLEVESRARQRRDQHVVNAIRDWRFSRQMG